MQALAVAAANDRRDHFGKGEIKLPYRNSPAPLAIISLPSIDVEIRRYHCAHLNHSLSKRDRFRSNAKMLTEYFLSDSLDSDLLNSIVQSDFPTIFLEEYVQQSLSKWGSTVFFTNRVTPDRKRITTHLSKALNEFEIVSKYLLRLYSIGLVNDQWIISIANQGQISHGDLTIAFSSSIKEIMPQVHRFSSVGHFCDYQGEHYLTIEAEFYEPIHTHYLFKDAPIFVSHLLYNTIRLVTLAFNIGILPQDFLESQMYCIAEDVKELVQISGASSAEELFAYFNGKGTMDGFHGEYMYCEDLADLRGYRFDIESYFIMRPKIERFENNNDLSLEDYTRRLFDEAIEYKTNSLNEKDEHLVNLCIDSLRQILSFLMFHTFTPNSDVDHEEYNAEFYVACPIFTDDDGMQNRVYENISDEWQLSVGSCFHLHKDIPPQLMISRLQGMETGLKILTAFSQFNEELKCSAQI